MGQNAIINGTDMAILLGALLIIFPWAVLNSLLQQILLTIFGVVLIVLGLYFSN